MIIIEKIYIYNEYITSWYTLKQNEDQKPSEQRNNVLREINKLFMNALYGKMLQTSYFESEKIVNNIGLLTKFFRFFKKVQFIFLTKRI